MFAKQQGLCAICGKPDKLGKRLFIDHDHKTNKIRELLCHHCNGGLGQFFDSPDLLQSAINYLEKHGE